MVRPLGANDALDLERCLGEGSRSARAQESRPKCHFDLDRSADGTAVCLPAFLPSSEVIVVCPPISQAPDFAPV